MKGYSTFPKAPRSKTLPSDGFVPYSRYSFGKSYPSSQMPSMYSTAPIDRALSGDLFATLLLCQNSTPLGQCSNGIHLPNFLSWAIYLSLVFLHFSSTNTLAVLIPLYGCFVQNSNHLLKIL